jgi:hypothetical protein
LGLAIPFLDCSSWQRGGISRQPQIIALIKPMPDLVVDWMATSKPVPAAHVNY